MGIFGGSSFALAYFSEVNLTVVYLHGGFSACVFFLSYNSIFGIDEVKWMLIDAFLGVFGLYSEILSWAGREISSFPVQVHVVPFMHYVLYTSWLRQVVIEVANCRPDKDRGEKVSCVYLALSLGFYSFIFLVSKA